MSRLVAGKPVHHLQRCFKCHWRECSSALWPIPNSTVSNWWTVENNLSQHYLCLGIMFAWSSQYPLIKKLRICCSSSRVSSFDACSFHLITYFLLCGICTWRIMQLSMYSSGMAISFFLNFFTSSATFCCCRFSYGDCLAWGVAYWSLALCFRVDDSLRQ